MTDRTDREATVTWRRNLLGSGPRFFRPVQTWRTYLIMWLCSLLPLTVLHLGADPRYISVPMRLLAAVGNLFGPYAFFVLWLGGFPNAGKLPRLVSPYISFFTVVMLVVTAGMLVAIVLPLFLRREWGRLTCLAFFTLALLAWLWMGFMEIGGFVT